MPTTQREYGVFRSLAPFFLACVALIILFLLFTRPGLIWKLSLIKADFSSEYRINDIPESWTTLLGQSLEDTYGSLISRIVSKNGEGRCLLSDVSVEVERSVGDQQWETLMGPYMANSLSWLFWFGVGILFCSSIYSVWALRFIEQQSWRHAVAVSLLGMVVFFVILVVVLALLGPAVSTDYFNILNSCEGKLTLNASLIGFDFGTIFLALAGLGLELIGVATMIRQWLKVRAQAIKP